MAVDERAADVLGVELSGTGLRYGAEAKAVISQATATSRPAGLRDLLWQPTDLYPPEVLTGGLSAPGAPYEDRGHRQLAAPRLRRTSPRG